MNIFRRIVSSFVDCGHDQIVSQLTEISESLAQDLARYRDVELPAAINHLADRQDQIEDLEGALHKANNDLHAARLAQQLVERDRDAYLKQAENAKADVVKLTASYDRLRKELADETARANSAVEAAVAAHRELAEVLDRESALAERERELISAHEETLSRIAILETEIRKQKGGEQTSFVPPEPGGEVPQEEDEVVSNHLHELAYRLIGIWFEGKNHWVLARGEERIKAPIQDKEFLDRIHRGEVRFVAGDTLLADFRTITFRTAGGDLYATHSVEKVKRVIHPDEQLEIPQPEVAHA